MALKWREGGSGEEGKQKEEEKEGNEKEVMARFEARHGEAVNNANEGEDVELMREEGRDVKDEHGLRERNKVSLKDRKGENKVKIT